MSIGVVCNLADGVILGVDSAITVSGRRTLPSGQVEAGVMNVFEESEKLFQLDGLGLAVGVMATGLAMFGERTVESYIREFERAQSREGVDYQEEPLERITGDLGDFFARIYQNVVVPAIEQETGSRFEDVPPQQRPVVDLVAAGFSAGEYLSEVWRCRLPSRSTEPEELGRPQIEQVREPGGFGTNWYGRIEAIQRLYKGIAPSLLNDLMNHLMQRFEQQPTEEIRQEVSEIVARYEAQTVYAAMPLGTGIRHVEFLLDLVIGYTDFVVGAPVCAGRTRIAMITRDGFDWVLGHEPTTVRFSERLETRS